jgi:hypothetical protein
MAYEFCRLIGRTLRLSAYNQALAGLRHLLSGWVVSPALGDAYIEVIHQSECCKGGCDDDH